MYERSYGYKYAEQKNLTVAEIAKLIRADIKREVKAGMLPAHWQYSVRSESFSGGAAINVRVKGCADAWMQCQGIVPGSERKFADGSSVATSCRNVWCKAGGQYKDSPSAEYHDVLTQEGEVTKLTLERIHGAYNHDGSDSQVDYFDVNYYGGVDFQSNTSARWEQEHQEAKAAKRAALDAASELIRVKVYGRQGSRTVHLAAEVDGATRLVCGARLWRSSVASKTEEQITCSRCAKRES